MAGSCAGDELLAGATAELVAEIIAELECGAGEEELSGTTALDTPGVGTSWAFV